MSTLLDTIPVHKVVEVNLSTALRIGHVLAQHKFVAKHEETFLDNGIFLCAAKDKKDELVLPKEGNALKTNYYLHYTDELNSLSPLLAGNKYFTVPMETVGRENLCYPRMLALYTGDTYTTNNYTGTLETATHATVDTNGVLKLDNKYPATSYEGPVFTAKPTTLPDGTKAVEVTVLDPHVVVGA